MRIAFVFIALCLALGLTFGCGSAPAPKAEAAAAPAAEETPAAAPAEDTVADQPVEPTAVEVTPEAAPDEDVLQIAEVVLVNGLRLEGLIVKENASEVELRTEVGTIILSRDRIKKIGTKDLPPAALSPGKKKRLRD